MMAAYHICALLFCLQNINIFRYWQPHISQSYFIKHQRSPDGFPVAQTTSLSWYAMSCGNFLQMFPIMPCANVFPTAVYLKIENPFMGPLWYKPSELLAHCLLQYPKIENLFTGSLWQKLNALLAQCHLLWLKISTRAESCMLWFRSDTAENQWMVL